MISSAPATNSRNSLATSAKRGLPASISAEMPCTSCAPGIDLPVRLQVVMQGAVSAPAIDKLDTPKFDDAVAFLDLQPGRFGVQHDLSHVPASLPATFCLLGGLPHDPAQDVRPGRGWPAHPPARSPGDRHAP